MVSKRQYEEKEHAEFRRAFSISPEQVPLEWTRLSSKRELTASEWFFKRGLHARILEIKQQKPPQA